MEARQKELQKNPKKRKRSPSVKSGASQVTMTLRSRYKKLRPNEQNDNDDMVSVIGGDAPMGASYIRYEIIEKKGKQFLVPVRYSIRRTTAAEKKSQLTKAVAIDEHEMELERLILN